MVQKWLEEHYGVFSLIRTQQLASERACGQ